GDPSRCQTVGRGQPIPDGYGGREDKALLRRVGGKGLLDEMQGGFFFVLEGANGAAYHVVLDHRAASDSRVGDLVSFATKPEPAVRTVDRRIADLARTDGCTVSIDQTSAIDDSERIARR